MRALLLASFFLAAALQAGEPAKIFMRTYDVTDILAPGNDMRVPKKRAINLSAGFFNMDFLIQHLHDKVRPEMWDPERNTDIKASGDKLIVVRQSSEVQAEVAMRLKTLHDAMAAPATGLTVFKDDVTVSAAPNDFGLQIYLVPFGIPGDIADKIKKDIKPGEWDFCEVEPLQTSHGVMLLITQKSEIHKLIKPYVEKIVLGLRR